MIDNRGVRIGQTRWSKKTCVTVVSVIFFKTACRSVCFIVVVCVREIKLSELVFS